MKKFLEFDPLWILAVGGIGVFVLMVTATVQLNKSLSEVFALTDSLLFSQHEEMEYRHHFDKLMSEANREAVESFKIKESPCSK